MHWLFAFVGAWFGAVVGAADKVLLGVVLGALLGWQGGRLLQLRQRLDALEAGRARADPTQSRAAPTEVPAARPSPAVAPSPEQISAAPTATPAPGAASSAAVDPWGAAPVAARAAAAPAAAGDVGEPPPRSPDLVETLSGFLRRALFEGNVPVKIGLLLLFVGVAGALKYAADAGWLRFPIEFRLAAIAAAALAGLVWGWRNRHARPAFGLSLQGGAIGVLLLVVFAAFRLYGLVPAGAAFVLVLVLVGGAAALAVLQNAAALAVLGFVGGYLAPLLISTGSGNHVALFSYYAVLNAAVFAIAWWRAWRALNLIGFGFTFAVGTLWGYQYYRPEHYATVQPFLALFVAFYIAIAVLHALKGRRPLVDGTLLFGTPLLAFPLQAALLADDRMGLAFSALLLAAVYAALGWWLRGRRELTLLWQSFAVLALGFATLAVPLAFSARATAATWALEGAALIWLGLRQARVLPQAIGWLLQVLAGLAFVVAILDAGWRSTAGEWPIFNGHALGALLLSVSGLAIAWVCERHGRGRLPVWSGFLLGLFWWAVGGLREIDAHRFASHGSIELLGLALLTLVLAVLVRQGLGWSRPGWVVVALSMAAPLLVLVQAEEGLAQFRMPLVALWAAWVLAMLWALAALRQPLQRGLSIAHVGLLWTLALWLGFGFERIARTELALGEGWQFVAGVLPLTLLLFAAWHRPRLLAWPLEPWFARYRPRWTVPAAAVLAAAWLFGQFSDGNPAPLPFLPLVNPLELFQFVLLLLAWRATAVLADPKPLRALLALPALLWVSMAGLRATHYLAGLPWSPRMLDHEIAQATLSVLWCLAGVAAWVAGSRRRNWPVWCGGAALLAVVLLKLLLVDRRYMGDLAGIVSFLAVGGLLVLVGRIAPTPPRRHAEEAT